MKRLLALAVVLLSATLAAATPRSGTIGALPTLACSWFNDDYTRSLFGPGYSYGMTLCTDEIIGVTSRTGNTMGSLLRDSGDLACSVLGTVFNPVDDPGNNAIYTLNVCCGTSCHEFLCVNLNQPCIPL